MKKTITILLLVLFLSLNLVIADRYEDNNIKYGKIDSGGNLIETSTPINGASVLGFVCSSADCGSVSGRLWSNILNTNTDFIQLVYPYELLSNFGYGVYFFKDGYIPYEVDVDWWGTNSGDPVGPYDNYLSKKEMCVSDISNLGVALDNHNVDVNLKVKSPIDNSGPLDYIPSELKEHYSADVGVELDVLKDDSSYYEKTESVDIPFSEKKNVGFSFAAEPGDYELVVSTFIGDDKCLSYEPDEQIKKFTICYVNNDCGSSACIENGNYCGVDGNIYHDYAGLKCENPGTLNGVCSQISESRKIGTCLYGCGSGKCLGKG